MKLEKAIEIAKDLADRLAFINQADEPAAVKLLIEAGERIQEGRKVDHAFACVILPGETEDGCKFCGAVHAGIECPDRGREK